MVSFRSAYHPIEVAILWSDLTAHEAEILQVELSTPGCLLKYFPQWPKLHTYAERIYDAVICGELPATYLGAPIIQTDRAERPYWSIRHIDLLSWFFRSYPNEKPNFLFPRNNEHSECVSLGVYFALKADRDILLREVERLRKALSAIEQQIFKDGQQTEKYATEDAISESSAALLYVIIGSLLTLILYKSESGKPHSIYKNQSAIVEAITAQYPDVYGLKKRTLDRKFAEARRRFAQVQQP